MKPDTTVFLIFLLLTFISGIYFCATHEVHSMTGSMIEGFDPKQDLQGPTTIDCPDLLIKSGNSLLLFNSKLPKVPGTNPLPFYSLEEYTNYLEDQRSKGIHCPVLFVQEENNTQGKNVFRVRPDVFSPQAGLPIAQPIPVTDASREHAPWNNNQYQGFDPTGQNVGQYTTLDALHNSTFQGKPLSENPMDGNWGGVIYTKQAVDSGKYKENEVVPPSQQGPFLEESDNVHNQKLSQTNIFA